MRIYLCLLTALALAGCNEKSSSPPPPPLPAAYAFNLSPASWMFQHSPGHLGLVANADGGWYFDFVQAPDTKGANSVHYLVTVPPGSIGGSTLELDYEIVETGSPVYQGALGDSNNTCASQGAHFDLYVQRRGDTLGASHEHYRWWFRAAKLNAGRGTIQANLQGGAWSHVFGKPSAQYPNEFRAALADPMAVGLTFGWGCFAGHGVNLAPGSGTSRFIVRRFATR